MIAHIGSIGGPHQGQLVLAAGAPLDQAQAAIIALHGRGGVAQNILDIAVHLQQPGFAYLAPQAAGNSWYPNHFMTPLAGNEPWLTSALAAVADLLAQLESAGIPPARAMLLGFSQGACLALEFAARNPRRYGGVAAFSGGLIGPEGTVWNSPGALNGTPVFIGCSDVDPFIPLARVHESAAVMRRLGADVAERIYPGMSHLINQDEIDFARAMMAALLVGNNP